MKLPVFLCLLFTFTTSYASTNSMPNFVDLVKEVRPAVVFISITKEIPRNPMSNFNYPGDLEELREFFRGPGRGQGQHRRGQRQPKEFQSGLGSGFIIDLDKGLIFTNNHVVGDASEITVKTFEGKTYKAKVIGKDASTDSAIIEVKNLPKTLKELNFANENDIETGEWVLAIGAPMGLDQTVTHGIISSKYRANMNIIERGYFIQTDAAINPGNSGGPLINMKGLVVGMNTAILSRTGENLGIGFATSSEILQKVRPKLIKDGEVKWSKIGIQIQELDDDMKKKRKLKESQFGVMIASVMPGSPSEKAGLKDQDVIYKVNDVEIRDGLKLQTEIGLQNPGTKVNIQFYRDGKSMSKSVKTERLNNTGNDNDDDQADSESIGFRVEEYDGSISGVQIVSVDPGHLSWRKGIRVGQIINKIDGKEVKNLEDFYKAIKNKKEFEIRVTDERGQYSNYFVIKKGH